MGFPIMNSTIHDTVLNDHRKKKKQNSKKIKKKILTFIFIYLLSFS